MISFKPLKLSMLKFRSTPAIVPIAVHTVRIEGDDVYVALSEES